MSIANDSGGLGTPILENNSLILLKKKKKKNVVRSNAPHHT